MSAINGGKKEYPWPGQDRRPRPDLQTTSVPSIAESLIATPPAEPGKPEATAPAGAVVAVIEGDRRIVSTAGFADLQSREVMTQNHVHDLASVSKLLTVLTLQRLFSLGELTPQETLGRVFGATAGSHWEVTVDDLLRHQSGFAEWWPLYLAGDETQDALDPITHILGMAPRYPRAAQWHYSDLGMQVAGTMIAKVTQSPLAAAVRELILDPLGAATITAGIPYSGAPVASGPHGDAIEKEMVSSNIPYPVDAQTEASAAEFPWRTETIRGDVADCNAFHAFGSARGQAAGHAGWFGDAEGLLTVAQAFIEPEAVAVVPQVAAELACTSDSSPDPRNTGFAQGRGARLYTLKWRGRKRRFLAHPGFTGTFVAVAPATEDEPAIRAVMLTNRLHGNSPPTRRTLISVDQMWRRSMRATHAFLHPESPGGTPTHSDPASPRPKRTGGAS